MTEESDNAHFEEWKDELEIRASEHIFNPTIPLLFLGIILLAFMADLFRGSIGKT